MTNRRVIAFLATFWTSLGLLGLTLAHGWWVVFPVVWMAVGVLTASEGRWLAERLPQPGRHRSGTHSDPYRPRHQLGLRRTEHDRKPLPGRHRNDTLWLVS